MGIAFNPFTGQLDFTQPPASPTTVTTIGTIDSGTPAANGASISSNSLILQSASATVPGLVNTGTQTFAGTKTFNNTITASISGNAGTVTVSDAASDTTTFPLLGTDATGSLTPRTDAGFTYNANTNALTTTTFIGALTGNADTATLASTVTTNANLTGPITSVGNATSVAAQTGTGTTFVMQASPTLTTPDLGTPSAAVLTNATGTATALNIGGNAATVTVADASGDTTTFPLLGTDATGSLSPRTDAGLTYNANTNTLTTTTFVGALTGNADTVTTNANLTGPITSTGNATAVAAQTGTGSVFVMQASPTLTTPDLGTPTALVGTNITGTAAGFNIGGNAATVTVSDASSDTTMFPLLATDATGSLTPRTDAGLSYNANTNVLTSTFVGDLTGNVTGNVSGSSGSTTGNAATATALQTARDINGVSFNGTANITVTAAAGTLTGTTLAATVVTSSLTSVGTLTDLTVTNPIVGGVTGNAGTVTVSDAGADTTTFVLLATDATGSLTPRTDAGLSYNANTNALTATTFIGALTGNASTVTTNANLTGPITSTGNATAVAAQTGTGTTFVMQASPTLTTPDIGTPSAGVLTSCTGLPIVAGTTGTLTETRGGTNQTTYTAGDTLYSSASNTLSKLTIGTQNQAMVTNNGLPAWAMQNQYLYPNYLAANPDAKLDTTGWATYADAAGNVPVNGTAGSPNSTLTRSTSSPMRGVASFLWTKNSGASRQGEGFSFDFTIDSADQAQVLAVNADYIIASGTFTAADGITAPLNDGTTTTNAGNSTMEFFMYDVTNSVLIPISPQVLTSNSTTNAASFKGTFQTSSNSTSYRLIVHTAMATDAAMTMKFDNFFVGRQTVAYGYAGTDWQTYGSASSFSAGFGTVTSPVLYYRQVGSNIECKGTGVTGTVAASTGSIDLPTGFVFDTTKNPASNGNGNFRVGSFEQDGVAYRNGTIVTVPGTSTTKVYVGPKSSDSNILAPQNMSTFYGNTSAFSFSFTVPIVGLSSNVLMSNDADTRLVEAQYTGNAGGSITANVTNIDFTTKVNDTHAAWSGTVFTAPVSGQYNISGCVKLTTGAARGIFAYKNGSSIYQLNSAASLDAFGLSGSVYLVSGDTLSFRSDVTATLSNSATIHWISINRISGPASIAATNSVNARYYSCTTAVTGSFTTQTFATKEYDSHNAYSAGTYTIPISGKYSITGCRTMTAASGAGDVAISIYKNGTETSSFYLTPVGVTNNNAVLVTDTLSCVAGDLITIRSLDAATTPASVTSNTRNFFSIFRVGN